MTLVPSLEKSNKATNEIEISRPTAPSFPTAPWDAHEENWEHLGDWITKLKGVQV